MLKCFQAAAKHITCLPLLPIVAPVRFTVCTFFGYCRFIQAITEGHILCQPFLQRSFRDTAGTSDFHVRQFAPFHCFIEKRSTDPGKQGGFLDSHAALAHKLKPTVHRSSTPLDITTDAPGFLLSIVYSRGAAFSRMSVLLFLGPLG